MATFDYANATIEDIWTRVPLVADRYKYERKAFHLVTYDDGNQYFEPENTGPSNFTWVDRYPYHVTRQIRIVDIAPGAGVTEFV